MWSHTDSKVKKEEGLNWGSYHQQADSRSVSETSQSALSIETHQLLLLLSATLTLTAWQHTDGCHEKLDIRKADGEKWKKVSSYTDKNYPHSAGNQWCVLSDHTKHFCFYFPFLFLLPERDLLADVSLKEGRVGSTQTPASSPPPPASPPPLGDRRDERLDRNYSPCLSHHCQWKRRRSSLLILWLKEQNKNGTGLNVMTQPSVE